MDKGNIFSSLPAEMPEEFSETLAWSQTVKIERIVSRGHRSPAGFWYDQEQNEWVLLLQGAAGIYLENTPGIMALKAGDYLNIPAHVRHRVEWTADNEETVWLAIHY